MSFLNDILDVKKEEVKKLYAERSLNSFSDEEFFNSKTLSLRHALIKNERLGIIAEIKKASPSKGILKTDFSHIKIAEEYFEHGIDAISVLTDKIFFQGNISFINDIAKFKTAPLLRKDFIIDPAQVYEAKAFGADAVLLISEALSKNQINELTHASYEIGLEVLLELHSESQLPKIDFQLNEIIGINNRDLDTFKEDIGTSLELSEKIPQDTLLISESGLSSREHIRRLFSSNVKAVLVGEFFMKAPLIKDRVIEFKDWCTYES